jgi:hypothetical protein
LSLIMSKRIPSNIDTHLKDKCTHNMAKEDRDQIIQEVQKIEGLIQHKGELNLISSPPAHQCPIPVLQEPRENGIQCQSQDDQGRPCRYIACQLQKIQKHYQEQHKWVNPQKRGGQEAGREVTVLWKPESIASIFLFADQEPSFLRCVP